MFNKYGRINFPSLFNVFYLNNNDYIELTGLENCKDLSNDKYFTTVKIMMDSNPSMSIFIHYVDDTVDIISTTLLNFATDFTTHFGNNIESVGGIHTNTTVISVLEDVDNVCSIITDENYMFLFQMNSPRNHVNKDLIHVGNVKVSYTRPITHKRVILDMKRTLSDIPFNYVLLTVLNRYYYVTSATLTNEFYSMVLDEDVLMSFKKLIRTQSAFIERNENDYDADKVDDLVTYDYDKYVTYDVIVPTKDVYKYTSTGDNNGYWVLLGV